MAHTQPLAPQSFDGVWKTIQRSVGWLLMTKHTDPAQQGAARVLAGILSLGVIFIPALTIVSLTTGNAPWIARLSNLAVGATITLAWWLNRRGSRYGGLIAALIGVVTQPLFLPDAAIQLSQVPLLVGTSLIIAVIFSGPQAGLITIAAYCTALYITLLSRGFTAPTIVPYTILSAIEFLVAWAVLWLPTSAFHRALRERAIAFAELQRFNADLEARVRERTAELATANAQLGAVMERRQHELRATAHDLNHGLSAARYAIEILLLDVEDAGLDSKQIKGAQQGVERAFQSTTALANNLFTVALLESDRLELTIREVDLTALAEGTLQQLSAQAQRQRCCLTLDIMNCPAYVPADAQRIERVLTNLVGNAIKYTSQAVAESEQEGQITIRVAQQADGVAVLIIDEGPGMSKEDLERVGQPYTRLNTARGTDGTGLGIYTSKGVVAAHGGTLHFASEGLGRGTTVTVWLPYSTTTER